MQQIDQKYWELMARVLAGEATTGQREELEVWMQENRQNRELFMRVRNDWERTASSASATKYNVDAAWEKQKKRIQGVPGMYETESPVHQYNFRRTIIRVAALVLLLIATGAVFFILQHRNAADELLATTNGQEQQEVTLPDGSTVVLNEGATLRYPKTFGKTRKVKLTGEAFFQVTKNPERPFVVDAGNATVTVLGTTFNVNSSPVEDKEVEVFVETGRVKVTPVAGNKGQSLILDPGYIGRVYKHRTEKLLNTNENYMAWRTRQMIFRDTPLPEVASTLERVYHVNVELKGDSLKNCRFSSTFIKQDLNLVLEVISTTFDLTIKQDKSKIVLTGKGC